MIMNIETLQSNIQSAEQYTIRAKREAQSAEAAQASQQVNQNETQPLEVDTYDKDNPVGVQAEGVYSVSHDDEGNLTVKYTQPASKSEDESSSATKASDSSGNKTGGAAPASTTTESTSSSDDDELEQLQQQKQALQQQLNRESDENVKAQLRTQLQNVEAQIIQLKMN